MPGSSRGTFSRVFLLDGETERNCEEACPEDEPSVSPPEEDYPSDDVAASPRVFFGHWRKSLFVSAVAGAGLVFAVTALNVDFMKVVNHGISRYWQKFPPNVDPGGFIDGQIWLAHDRKLCVQPTTGLAHDWKCVQYKGHQNDAWCKKKAAAFRHSEIRHGWETEAFGDRTQESPCGCGCCRRWVHGRPEPGGGLNIRLWPCSVTTHGRQHLLLPKSGRGPIRLKNWPKRCLTVSGSMWPVGNDGDGHQIFLYKCGQNDWHGQIWILPEHGQGRIKWARDPTRCLDGGRVNKGEKLGVKLQVWNCQKGNFREVNQLFLLSHKAPNHIKWHEEDFKPARCPAETWHDRIGKQTCGECSVPVRLTPEKHRNCYLYCHSEGRTCLSAKEAVSGCVAVGSVTCSTPVFGDRHAICECGEKLLRGNYGSLSEFWIEPERIRQRVRYMVEHFGIREFAFEYAFEGFSNPPSLKRNEWNCKLQNRPVKKKTVAAAIDEITKLGGRSWLMVYAASADRDDASKLAGEWKMPHQDVALKLSAQYFDAVEQRRLARRNSSILRYLRSGALPENDGDKYGQAYQEMCGCTIGTNINFKRDPSARVMDMVNPNPVWAMKVVPSWARFAGKMGFQGIHWETFGAFGHWNVDDFPKNPFGHGAPEPDLVGFLRAALPILASHNLEQTMHFVNGYGWDQVLMTESSGWFEIHPWVNTGGRAISFPYWEVWDEAAQNKLFEAAGYNQFVMAMYPGYSKYHCCRENERQNADEFGVTPFDLAVRRLREASIHGGTYHLVIDGRRYIQSPFVADAVRMKLEELKELADMYKQVL